MSRARAYVRAGVGCETMSVVRVASRGRTVRGLGYAVTFDGVESAWGGSTETRDACATRGGSEIEDVDGGFEITFEVVGEVDDEVDVRLVRSDRTRYAREVHLGSLARALRAIDANATNVTATRKGVMRANRRDRSDAFDRAISGQGGVRANWTESLVLLVDSDISKRREVVFREIVVESFLDGPTYDERGGTSYVNPIANTTIMSAEKESYERAIETLSDALRDAQDGADQTIPESASFALLWSLLGAFGAILIAVACYVYVRRRRNLGEKVESTKTGEIGAGTTSTLEDLNTTISPIKSTMRRRATPTKSRHVTGEAPIFAHSTAFARGAVSRVDSLGAALRREDSLAENGKHVTLHVNRTQDSEEFHQHALEINERSDAYDTATSDCEYEYQEEQHVELTAGDFANEIMRASSYPIERKASECRDDTFRFISNDELDRYVQVIERLGAGGHSSVYMAKWGERQVALKMLHDENASSMQSEIEIMRAIDHPNIVKIFGACQSPACLILQIVHGGSLYEVLHCSPNRRGVGLAEDKALPIARDIASAMTYCHELTPKIIHRDLKPQNVLIEQETLRAYLADFGVSRQVSTRLNTNSYGAGTVNYMAPELFGDERADEKVDVYSFAMILYETLTGKQPWVGLNAVRIASILLENATETSRPALPPSAELNLRASTLELIQKCWRFDPRSRPSFREILTELEQVL